MRDLGEAPLLMLGAGMLDECEDPELVRALVENDPLAPRALWRRYAPIVFRVLTRSLGESHDIEDLAQDVFLSAFRKVPTLRDPQALKAFVVSIAIRTSKWERRRRKVRRLIRLKSTEDLSSRAVVHLDTDAREALERFYRVLDHLDSLNRTLFVLRFIEELDLSTIAAVSGLSLSTVKRRLSRTWSKVCALVERDPALSSYVARDAPRVLSQ